MDRKIEKVTKEMDPSIRENVVGEPHVNRQRTCYAIKTLVSEVLAMFPETEYDVAGYNDRNVGLEVTFDTAGLKGLYELLSLVEGDPRVAGVYSPDEDTDLTVIFRNSARTQDLRDPFGLDEAWDILEEQAEDEGWYIGGESE